MTPPVLELRGIRKRFGAVEALRGADFVLRAGEIHALLGENGAGKTTLMDIAYGLTRADAGVIACAGQPVAMRSPAEARARGIGMVHQHFTSVPALTVRENLALATGRPRWSGPGAGESGSEAVLRLWEGLDPDARVAELSVALKQRLEVVKALAARARVLLLDEPTAVLAPAEVEALFHAIRGFAAGGGAVVLITHKLAEALAVGQSVTVLRHGAVTLSGPLAGRTAGTLASAMLGAESDVPLVQEPAGPPAGGGGAAVVRLRDVTVPALDRRGPGLRRATLEVRGGEILGIAAIEGSGQRELLLAIAGLLRPAAGTLEVEGPVALVPEDRTTEGLIPSLTLTENIVLGSATEPARAPWVHGGWMDWPRARAHTGELLEAYGIRSTSTEVLAATLSGGNQQRLVLARALSQEPRVLVVENPTRGLDLRATRAIQTRLQRAAGRGIAVLVYSSDLDEVLALAHRIAVVAGGRLREMTAGAAGGAGAGRAAVGQAMLGLAGDGGA